MEAPTPIATEVYEVEVTGDGDEMVVAALIHFNDPPAVLYHRLAPLTIWQDVCAPAVALEFDFNCN